MGEWDLIVEKMREGNERSVLATIIKVEGSAYRKEGTVALITESGAIKGMISIGCLEEDLVIRAQALLQHPEYVSAKAVYDMSSEDDLGWGRGVGCNGKVHILLEEVTSSVREQCLDAYEHLQQGMDVMAIKNLQSIPGGISTEWLPHKKHQEADFFEKNRWNILVANTFYHHLTPKSRLFIFGAGVDAEPLAAYAVQNGFSVYIWDWRLTYLNAERFPHAHFMTSITDIHFSMRDFVVIMTHDFQKDQEILHQLRREKIQYLGVLGPKKRTSRLLKHQEIPDYIHSPVGLPIGAEGPVEIAVSIVADLIRVKRGVAYEQHQDSGSLFSGGEKQEIWRR